MSYEMLLNDLEALQKSYAADDSKGDDKIAAAAKAADGDEDEELDEDGKPIAKKKVEPDGDEGNGNPFAKSFTLIGEDGVETEAVDGTEMVKALHGELEALTKSFADEKGDLSKSFTILTNVIKSQGALIKSLRDDLTNLANQGAGRKSVTGPTVEMAKSIGAQLTPQTLMLKANTAFTSGRISGKDLTMVDVSMRQGEELSPELVARILAE